MLVFKQLFTFLPLVYTKSQNRSNFLLSVRFCQAVRPIFEIGIFLSLCPILCNSCPIMSQRFQNKFSRNLWTKKTEENFQSIDLQTCQFHLKSLTQDRTRIAQNWTERQKNSYLKNRSEAWQNRTDSLAKSVGHDKNRKHHCLCKRGVKSVLFHQAWLVTCNQV